MSKVIVSVRRVEITANLPHWDVIQDEKTRAQSKSGLPMFGDKFRE
jgi:hypothetical protein